MPINVEISDDAIMYLNGPAQAELQSVLSEYAGEILREAGRLEDRTRSTKGDPEITSSHIRDAATGFDRGRAKLRRPIWVPVIQVLSIAVGVGTGYIVDELVAGKTWAPPAFVVAVTVTILLGAIVIFKEWYNE